MSCRKEGANGQNQPWSRASLNFSVTSRSILTFLQIISDKLINIFRDCDKTVLANVGDASLAVGLEKKSQIHTYVIL